MTSQQEEIAKDIIEFTKKNKDYTFHLGTYSVRKKNNGEFFDEYLSKIALEELVLKGVLIKNEIGYYEYRLSDTGKKWKSFKNQRRKEWWKPKKEFFKSVLLLIIGGGITLVYTDFVHPYFLKKPAVPANTVKESAKKVAPQNIKAIQQPLVIKPIAFRQTSLRSKTETKSSLDTSKKAPNSQFNFNNSPVTNSAVGINPTVINNNGIKQRHVSKELVNDIMNKIPDKKLRIAIGIPDSQEAENYADEIIQYLSANGYESMYKYSLTGNRNKEIKVDYQNNKPFILIPSQSDIQ